MDSQGKSLAIAGGGAAGLAAAIAAGQRAAEFGMPLNITVYERDDRVGRSILATGNGRCNFSNAHIQAQLYHNADFVGRAYEALGELAGEDAVHAFFASLGLVWRQEDDGRQYPLANKASVVVDVLRAAAAELGVREACEQEVAAIVPPRKQDSPFTLRMKNGVLKRADAVVVASGGRTVYALEAEELPRLAPRPVLGPLAVSSRDKVLAKELDNIRVKAQVSLFRRSDEAGEGEQLVAQERGELMFRKYGVSGICVFDLSRYAQPGDILRINFLEGRSCQEACDYLTQRRAVLAERYGQGLTYVDFLRGLLLPRVSEALVKNRFINPYNRFTAKDIPALAALLTGYSLEVEGIADAAQCQVRRGGFCVESFDPTTMQAHALAGLYVVGEALDVDGPCGGYNLHWAWSSGLIAGRCAADALATGALAADAG